ncbi:MAG TPA: hypothetical protein VGA16_01650 [Candidatus Limnocylindria bacterium]
MTPLPTTVHFLGAHGASPDGIVAWIAAAGTPAADLQLTVGGRPHPLGDSWTTFGAGGFAVRAQRITIEGLPPGRDHPLRLIANGELVASAEASTLPAALPSPPDRPFTILLGSCFSVLQDAACLVGAAVERLPAVARPHVTILCGDQVYLDSPALHFLACTHSRDELAQEHLQRYLTTWSQRSDLGGFQRVLTAADTFFCSDDHDLWNNAPNAAPYVRDTWTAEGCRAWREVAIALFELFQAPRQGEIFAVGALSCFVADTRLARTADRVSFMTAEQMTELGQWIRGLDGPGLLVVGQPVFVGETGWRGQFFDRGLADYRQYAELVRVVSSTPHDLVILTGDVHFGRFATCELPSGRRVHEVISSPLALVHRIAAGKWGKAVEAFPAVAVPTVAQAPVSTASYQRIDEHFLTLGFTGVGASVHMDVTAWPVRVGSGPWGEPVASTVLH